MIRFTLYRCHCGALHPIDHVASCEIQRFASVANYASHMDAEPAEIEMISEDEANFSMATADKWRADQKMAI